MVQVTVERKPIHYGAIVSKLNKIDETLREFNQVTNSAFLPSLPNGIDTAQLIEKGANERPLRVLSFDGGGVRGLSSLLLLKAVMDKVSPNKKPCELFDMIGGTSTGGIGTGIGSNTPVPDTLKSIADFASIATNSEITHNLFSGLIDAFAPQSLARKYWRLNVGVQIPEWEEEKGMLWWKHKELHPDNFQDVGNLDDLRKLRMLEELTEEYVKSNDAPIGECAKALVDAT
ncbi:putative protein kinase subdomain-containing protein [Diplodia seriata]|uniref:PNPLA domain-containing protein n=1 Tax=Diplodia seriata TaxID=420778 RepID=A0A0G2GZB7_9PEZI|nr:putative protein kinase subdomain-containing protein [Diplodia seriata]